MDVLQERVSSSRISQEDVSRYISIKEHRVDVKTLAKQFAKSRINVEKPERSLGLKPSSACCCFPIKSSSQATTNEKTTLLTQLLPDSQCVIRDGVMTLINATEVKRGDILFLNEGKECNCDARILFCEDFIADDFVFAGKSVQRKRTANICDCSVFAADNILLAGCHVVSGIAYCLVLNTGKNTVVGKLIES